MIMFDLYRVLFHVKCVKARENVATRLVIKSIFDFESIATHRKGIGGKTGEKDANQKDYAMDVKLLVW